MLRPIGRFVNKNWPYILGVMIGGFPLICIFFIALYPILIPVIAFPFVYDFIAFCWKTFWSVVGRIFHALKVWRYRRYLDSLPPPPPPPTRTEIRARQSAQAQADFQEEMALLQSQPLDEMERSVFENRAKRRLLEKLHHIANS